MRCVLYLRMSRDIQEKSPGDQRKALTQYAAKKGFKIVGEYIDEGISGDATEKRLGFRQLIQDCSLKRFEAVLCWDQDRFGRFDPLEAGFWIKPMRDAGVVLETIAQGRIDWNDFAGRLVWSVNQEAKHGFLKDISRNSLRGNINRAKSGRHTGRVPFGYVLGADGRLQLGEQDAVDAVRRAFELRTLGYGYRVIAIQLQKEGHPSPSGKTWSHDGVRLILNREIYTGCLVYGRKHRGKYSTMVNGETGDAIGGKNKTNRTPVRVPDSHPAIIDAETWRAVEAMHRDPPKPHATRGNSGAPLAGILRCGMCNGPMYSQSMQRKAGQKNPNYICGTYMLGRGCGYCAVQQKKIHQLVKEHIIRECGGSLERLTERIREKMAVRRPKNELAAAMRKLKLLDDRIAAAEKRLLIVNDRLFETMQEQILTMRDKRNELALSLKDNGPAAAPDPSEMARELWGQLMEFGIRHPSETRQMIRKMYDHIRLEFRLGQKTGRGQSFDFIGFKCVRK